jgi:hypothetical protein
MGESDVDPVKVLRYAAHHVRLERRTLAKIWPNVAAVERRFYEQSGGSEMKVPQTKNGAPLRSLGAAVAAVLCVLISGSTAFAAGSGYGPGSPPPSAAAGGFTKIITTKTLHSSGGTIKGSANGATVVVVVPKGALPQGGQIVLSDGPPKKIDVGKNLKVLADFSVVVLNPNNGARLSGPYMRAITVTIHDSAIRHGDKVVVVVKPGHITTISRAVISKGLATVTFTTDPNFAVVAPK